MGVPTVPFQVLSKGYTVRGSMRDGYKATVPFLVAWADAFTFVDQVMGATEPVDLGHVRLRLPWVFPAAAPARLYAQEFDVEPCGQKGEPLAPYLGLRPGEFFSHARVTVQFETPALSNSFLDDPRGFQQLDPENPLTLCEQSLRMGGKLRTRRGSGYVFTDGKALQGDVAVPEKEARLVLTFPRVPFLPWAIVQTFIGRLNDRPVLGCDTGTLIFEGADSRFTATTQGLQGQQLTLEFTWQEHDWNKIERPDDGSFDFVYEKGHAGDPDRRLFHYADFRDLFLTVETAD